MESTPFFIPSTSFCSLSCWFTSSAHVTSSQSPSISPSAFHSSHNNKRLHAIQSTMQCVVGKFYISLHALYKESIVFLEIFWWKNCVNRSTLAKVMTIHQVWFFWEAQCMKMTSLLISNRCCDHLWQVITANYLDHVTTDCFHNYLLHLIQTQQQSVSIRTTTLIHTVSALAAYRNIHWHWSPKLLKIS